MTAPDTILVNFAKLTAGAEALNAKAGQLNQNLSDLSTGVAPLKASWTETGSSAGQAYQQAEAKLTAAINDIVTTIAKFSQSVHEASSQQNTLEKTNTGYFA